jgi:adenosylhomocysteine nucleosidase
VALKDEAQFLSTSLPVLVTGLGKVNAAVAVAAVLNHGPLPSRVVNLGTAGALRAGIGGLHSIGTVIQHDLDAGLLHSLTREAVGTPIEVAEDGLVLASGDVFVSDDAERERLGAVAHLADMEGYAVAAAAVAAGVPAELVKHVSDEADGSAFRSWQENVALSARLLRDWAKRNVPGY